MSIVKLKPHLQHYLWGGRKLIDEYHFDSEENVAEAWVVSCHPDGPSVIAEGSYKDMILPEYIKLKGKEILGTKAQNLDRFPILIKLLDAQKDLSIQVHPNDEYALKHENELGKNEMWLVLRSNPGSYIYYGVKDPISKEDFSVSIEENTIIDKLQLVETQEFDFFYIPAGTIHAIGQGNLIVEVQQSSNCTYRIYDYNRVDNDGKKRELHLEKAIEVSNLEPITYSHKVDHNKKLNILVDNDFFKTSLHKVDGLESFHVEDNSFEGLVILKGEGNVIQNNHSINFDKGDSFFIHSNSRYKIEGNCIVLRASI